MNDLFIAFFEWIFFVLMILSTVAIFAFMLRWTLKDFRKAADSIDNFGQKGARMCTKAESLMSEENLEKFKKGAEDAISNGSHKGLCRFFNSILKFFNIKASIK